MKKCTFLDIREMQIKSTLRFYLTSVRMAIIKKQTTGVCRHDGRRIGIFSFRPHEKQSE
jgi:hypothetical protein